ncbi:RNA polymerase sigma-70 factor (ECF subfamily) [Pedobacter sp. AK017]|uniref:RNA polymerase sigma factor n=1 Tax=Pedobacter sp. AK017 TaxID=2723073 RepID=UPI00160752AF|nr:RNA polymerase sigma-70 factor [Pedobacter sp. AK017]MBB5438132.1 RNA polymerase sigma-70 factor (ECF subfamily) [Pedobacter sp. AK017]
MPGYRNLSDAELLKLLKQSNHAAYTEIYKRFSGLLYIFLCKRIKDQDDAKDILQELFTNLWLKRETIEVPGVLAAYLYSAVRNTMLNYIQRNQSQKRRIQTLKDFIDQEPVMTDHLIREKQLAAIIEKEVNLLPDKMRWVFLLTRKNNLSHHEIASELNISPETVHSHTKRALKILRVRLSYDKRC